MSHNVPVLTIDGPSGSGKGTVSQRVAEKLGWHYLDSGALYRVLGLLASREQIELSDESALSALVQNLDLAFENGQIWLAGEVVDAEVRTEQAGNRASKLAVLCGVRESLLEWQRNCAKLPGLVADGRDMGTVVFPYARCKIFLTAAPQERAKRRLKQLRDKGFNVSISPLLREIEERDVRDVSRAVSPLRPADNAACLDTTGLAIDQVVAIVIGRLSARMQMDEVD